MKINRLQIHNLASLLDVDIDFTASPLNDTGLFAITGDTGAGKSTLLDALCLALYDKTARLSNENTAKIEFNGDSVRLNDPRHLLRRGTGIGWVKVDFIAIDGNEYRAFWQVTRARKKANGRLQSPTHALYEMPSEMLVSDAKSETKKTIERLIGLNFEQFSRAVMLAQNEFSAFLRAQGDDRAALLERLSGTHKYSLVGQRVYEGYKAKKNDVDVFQQSMKAVHILSPEDEAHYTDELAKADAAQQQRKVRLEEVALLSQWFVQLKVLQNDIDTLNTQHAHVQQQVTSSSASVADAKRTAYCWQIEDTLLTAQRYKLRLSEQQQRIVELDKSDTQAEVDAARLALSKAHSELADADNGLRAAKPMLNEAIELDSRINQAREHEGKCNSEAEQIEKAMQDLSLSNEQLQHSLTSMAQQLACARDKFATQPWLVELVKNWSHYHHLWSNITRYNQHFGEKKDRLQALKEALSVSQRQVSELDGKLAANKSKTAQLAEQIATTQNQVSGRSAAHVQTQLSQQREDFTHFQQWQQSLAKYNKVSAQVEDTSTRLNQCKQQFADLRPRQSVLEQALAHAQQALQQVQLRASEEISHLRTQLVTGEPCMVCGSEHHPYAGQGTANSAFDSLLVDFEQQVNDAKAALDQHLTKCNELYTTSQLLEQQLQAHQESANGVSREIEQLRASLAHCNDKTALEDTSEQVFIDAIDSLEQELESLQKVESQLVKLRSEHQHSAQLQAQTQEQWQQTQLQSQNQQLEYQRQDDDLRNEQAQVSEYIAQLQPVFGSAPWWQDNAESLAEQWPELERGHHDYVQNETLIDDINHRIQQSSQARDQNFTKLESLAQQRDKLTQQAAEYQQQISSLLTKREHLCDVEVDPKQQLEALETRCKGAHQAHIQAQQLVQAKQSQYELERKEHEHLVKNCSQLHSDIEDLECNVEQWLAKVESEGVDITREQINHLLSRDKDQVKHVIAQYEQLQQQLLRLDAQLEQATSKLEAHMPSRPEQDEQTLIAHKEELESQWQQAQQHITLVSAKLENHQQNVRQLADKATELQQLQAQLATWSTLNTALGDAQGKRLRNLVQSQTLAILLAYANQHLQTLSKRYRLTRITGTLDIAIIDQDMADEQRSVNTLSGGESFLVSLALALGLASLSSNKVKIESLFIDEGFGTLDTETLNVAMDALDNLQAQGRKVGIISHIAQLTERVATQIKVYKRPGGYSDVVCE